MWTLFKLFRWVATGLVALWVISMIFDGGLLMVALYGSFLILPLALLWVVPAIFRHRPPPTKKHDPTQFSADIAHDNIAMDTKRDRLWIRDPKRGERYLDRSQVLNIRTNSDAHNGISMQRLEFQIRDVSQPMWDVLFQRHSDRWRSTSKRNGEERDEWFARMRAWLNAVPAKPTIPSGSTNGPLSLPELHMAYGKAKDEASRKEWLVAFDITCFTERLDARQEWERLGGVYPGPTPELLGMQGA